MGRAGRLQKRTGTNQDRLEETDSQHWTNVAREAVGAATTRTPTKSPKSKKRKDNSAPTDSPVQPPAKKKKTEEKKNGKKPKTTEDGKAKCKPLPPVVSTLPIEKVPGWAAIAIPYNYNELRAAFLEYNDFKWAAGKLNIRDKCSDQFLQDNWEAWRKLATPKGRNVETRKSFLHYAGLERNGIPIEWETVNLSTQMNKLEESDLFAAKLYLFRRRFEFRGDLVVREDPRAEIGPSKRKRQVVGAIFPQNQRTLRPHMPEIDDVRIAPPRGDTKGKSIANEEEEQNPNPSASKDTSAAPSGSGKSTRGYGDLPTKFHEFTSQRSQGLPDIISNPESVNKIMYATRLLCDVVEEHVVDNETNYSQFSQPVDLASSSQIEREKYERMEQRCLEAESKLEKLKQDYTVLCARKDTHVYPQNIDAYVANPDLVPELAEMRNAFEINHDTTWKEQSMYQFFSNELTGHVEKPYQPRDPLTSMTGIGGSNVEKGETTKPASKTTSDVSISGKIGVTNEVSPTPKKAGSVEAKKAQVGGVSGDDSPASGSHNNLSPQRMIQIITARPKVEMLSPTIPPLEPREIFPPSLLLDSQADHPKTELEPLELPASSSNNNSVLATDSEFVANIIGDIFPALKKDDIQGVVAGAPKNHSPAVEVVLPSTVEVVQPSTGELIVLSPEKSVEKKKGKKIPIFVSESLMPGRWVHSEVINWYITESIRPGMNDMPGWFFAHTHWYTKLEQIVVDEDPDSTTWDNTVLEKLERHRKGLLPPVENAVDIRYIVVPIHGENHWSVVLIHVNDARDACVIYHMDSVKTYHDHAQIGTLLSTWIELGLKLNMRTTIVATGIHLQKNSFDCGVHVLYIITKLIEAEKEGKLLQYLENGGVPTEWGTPEIVSNFRQELRDWFDQLSE
ncbi:hypothetical protein R1sor_018434 [Riccia sorocarpa]|uniref:Ubiquitin-like protease family profile domain-containing protein n=1 Tax=Riccia sorocarpa TaxID=122646 RepID=A0ABD3I9S1_9MARC